MFEGPEWLVQAAQSSETDAAQTSGIGWRFQMVLRWFGARSGKLLGIIGLVGYGLLENAANVTVFKAKNLPERTPAVRRRWVGERLWS